MQVARPRDRTTSDDGTTGFREICAVAVCAALGSSLYVLLAAWHGALGAARGDDWTYYRAAYALARDGSFSADPWAFTMLVGQLVLAQPVIALCGTSLTALQLMVASLGALGLVATYLVTRSFLSRGRAAFAVACLALGPIYGTLSVSFMTDVPAFALEALVLLTGLQSVRTHRFSLRWFAVSLVLGVVAFSIREYALAAPAAVSIVALRQVAALARPKLKYVAVLISAGLCVAASMYLWRHSLPGSSHTPRPSQSLLVVAAYVLSATFTLSLLTFPMVFLVSVKALARALRDQPRTALVVAGVVVLAGVLLLAGNGSVLMGNMVTARGSYPETLPGQPPLVLPNVLWQALTIVSLLSLLALAAVSLTVHSARRGAGVKRRPSANAPALTLSWAFCLMMFGEIVAVKVATPGVITDRYLFPIVPFMVAIAVHYSASEGLLVRRVRVMGIASLSLMALLGTAMVDAAATSDGAKWQFATSLQRKGVAPESIDGGYEWFGYHQPGPIVDFALDAPARNWWNRLFEEQDICVETRHATTPGESAGGIDETRIMARFSTRTLFGVHYDLVAVRIKEPCPVAASRNLAQSRP